ncbi:unnamed protein product [Cuscuta campestris]|uniref:RING-type domain-containing protein n=1 Tax=Cuscuta campestris TaxID=132261 RepID=A0A484KFM3_9ASTE|nr:unnamed protein product [Cuscuta campestris]
MNLRFVSLFTPLFLVVIFVMVLALMLKLIGFMDDGGGGGGDGGATESSRLLPKEAIPIVYGACGGGEGEDDAEAGDCGGGGRSNSPEELYEGNKICAICYDHKRCCFFVPCGHFATCLHCAKRFALLTSFPFQHLENNFFWWVQTLISVPK